MKEFLAYRQILLGRESLSGLEKAPKALDMIEMTARRMLVFDRCSDYKSSLIPPSLDSRLSCLPPTLRVIRKLVYVLRFSDM